MIVKIMLGLAVYLQVTDCNRGSATEILLDLVNNLFCNFYLICASTALIFRIKTKLCNVSKFYTLSAEIYSKMYFLEGNQSHKKTRWLKR